MILRRYITQQIASHTAIVLGFLVFLLLGGRLIRYFGIAAEGRLDVSLLFSIIGYNLPYFLELILPLSFFIALMLVFGRLYVDHEMAVMNASGISRGRLARMTAPLVLLLCIVEAGLSLVGKPWGVQQADEIWKEQAMQSAFDLIRPGEFIGSGDYHLYVGSLSDDNSQLQNVIMIQTNTNTDTNTQQSAQQTLANLPNLPKQFASKDTIVLAKQAQQVPTAPNSGKSQLDLFNGRRYEIGADSLKYNQVGFERYRLTLNQAKNDTLDEDNVETKPIATLWQVANSTSHTSHPNHQRSAQLLAQAELGYRFALPWLMLIAPMMAVPLAQVKPRKGRWLRLIPAILLFVSAALAIISLKKPISEDKISVWAYTWLIMALMVIALYLNWAGRIHQRLRFRLANQSSDTPPTPAGNDGANPEPSLEPSTKPQLVSKSDTHSDAGGQDQ